MIFKWQPIYSVNVKEIDDQHKKMHQEYINNINSFKEKGFSENQLKDFLQNWWIDHVQGADQEYSVFFNKKGLF